MRRFSFKADLRKPKGSPAVSRPAPQAPTSARDGLTLSSSLGGKRRNMRRWPEFQRALRALPAVLVADDSFEDAELAAEYVRIYGVTRQKILEAAPGFDTEGKQDIHCYFDDDGSKHLVSRLSARPNARVTELSLYPSGEVNRVYYECTGGAEQDLDELYETGLAGLEDDVGRFARYPNYILKFVSLACENGQLVDVYKGTCFYEESTATVATDEDDAI